MNQGLIDMGDGVGGWIVSKDFQFIQAVCWFLYKGNSDICHICYIFVTLEI